MLNKFATKSSLKIADTIRISGLTGTHHIETRHIILGCIADSSDTTLIVGTNHLMVIDEEYTDLSCPDDVFDLA